jgi:hypothetical protein
MATEYDLMLFDQHFQAALALPAAQRWSLERDQSVPLGIFCRMHPRTAPAEQYKVRLRWTDYSMPFSLKFINTENGSETDQHAWPNFEGSRPANFFVCAPYTSEGNGYHPEWALSPTNRYKRPDEPLVFALIQIQHLLDNTYQGRA